jgi:hypothetical protein
MFNIGGHSSPYKADQAFRFFAEKCAVEMRRHRFCDE